MAETEIGCKIIGKTPETPDSGPGIIVFLQQPHQFQRTFQKNICSRPHPLDPFGEYPGTGNGHASNGHPVTAGFTDHLQAPGPVKHIAVAEHRNRDSLLDPPDVFLN